MIMAAICICIAIANTIAISFQADDIDAIVDSHVAGRDAIWGLSCEYRFTDSTGSDIVIVRHGNYHQNGNRRIINTEFDGLNQFILADGEISWLLYFTRDGSRGLSKFHTNNNMIGPDDVALNTLLYVPIPLSVQCETLESSVKRAISRKVSRRSLDRIDPIDLEFSYQVADASGNNSIWRSLITLDPKVNFLISEHELSANYNGQQIRRVVRVNEFAEPRPGLHVPKSSTFHSFINGVQSSGERRIVLSNIQCGQILPPERFRLHYPRGTPMRDDIRGVRYTVDENGNPITEAKPSPKISLIAQPPKTESAARPAASWLPRFTFNPVIWLVVFAVTLITVAVTLKVRSSLEK